MPLAEANHQTQPGHPSRMPFVEANHQSQPGHPSRMSLAEANHRTQLDHPSRMPLAEANQKHNQHFIIGLTFVNNSINIHSWFNIRQQLNFINKSNKFS